jgi:hypothetical protein
VSESHQLKLASVVGLGRFLQNHGNDEPELAGLRRAMVGVAAAVQLVVASDSAPRALVDVDMALTLARLLLRSGLSEAATIELDGNAAAMLQALTQAADEARTATQPGESQT